MKLWIDEVGGIGASPKEIEQFISDFRPESPYECGQRLSQHPETVLLPLNTPYAFSRSFLEDVERQEFD